MLRSVISFSNGREEKLSLSFFFFFFGGGGGGGFEAIPSKLSTSRFVVDEIVETCHSSSVCATFYVT